MRRSLSFAAVALVALAAARPAAAQEAAGETFLCRGPFAFGIDQGVAPGELQPSTSWWIVDFEPAREAVGARGERLAPGQCGFAERGVELSEPTRVSFLRSRPPSGRIGDRDDLPQNHHFTQGARNQVGAWLERCSGDSACVVRAQVVADHSPLAIGFEATGPVAKLPALRVGAAPGARPSSTPTPRRDSVMTRPAVRTAVLRKS